MARTIVRFMVAVTFVAKMTLGQTTAILPSNFQNDTLAVTGLDRPAGLAWLPDGRLLIAQRGHIATGQIRLWTGTTLSLVGVVQGVDHNGTWSGVNGIAVDPQWPARPYLYVNFDSGVNSTQLSMFTLTGDLMNPTSSNLNLGTRYDILANPNTNQACHIHFGPDGMLYVPFRAPGTTGNCGAQDFSSGIGCLFRLDVTALPGSGVGPPPPSTLIPAGNPFPGPNDNARLCWAYGFAHPFSFQIDPVTSRIYVADTTLADEEVDEIAVSGQNYGYPWLFATSLGTTCGTGAIPPVVAPMVWWPDYPGSGISIGRYRNVPGGIYNFGAPYEGDYLFGDYYQGFIRRLKQVGSAWQPVAAPGQPSMSNWAMNLGKFSDAVQGSDGAIYYVCEYAGGGSAGDGYLGRIRGNPTAPELTIMSGNNQVANAGQTLPNPLVVRLMTMAGSPIAGAAVSFIPSVGAGSTNPAVATTDAQGFASTVYTLAPNFQGIPQITVTSPGAVSVYFHHTWRGIYVTYVPASSYFAITLRHSQANSPFTLCWETPPSAVPYLPTPWGAVWTSVLAPVPGLGALDGLGLLGPVNPTVKTPSNSQTWSLVVSPLPAFGGIPMLFQAYAVDTALLPSASAYMISNQITVTLN